MDSSVRNKRHQRDPGHEDLLTILNDVLEDDERQLTQPFDKPEKPVLFIVGNARSGSTLLYQWLASTGLFGYPSNIISRFYNAPYVGALIHKAFVDFDHHGELYGSSSPTFQSTLGKTAGALSPHEFWYFWRRFFPFGEIQQLSEEELSRVPSSQFLSELAALEYAFDKPILLKGMILNWNLLYLKDLIRNTLFLHIRRDEMQNMESLYRARIEFFGTTGNWYSFKPPEYPELQQMSLYEQLAGQVLLTNHAIEDQFDTISSKHHMTIDYDALCAQPKKVYQNLLSKLDEFGHPASDLYSGPSHFTPSGHQQSSAFNMELAREALQKMREITKSDT